MSEDFEGAEPPSHEDAENVSPVAASKYHPCSNDVVVNKHNNYNFISLPRGNAISLSSFISIIVNSFVFHHAPINFIGFFYQSFD